MTDDDRTVVDGFPSVGLPRALADCAEQLERKELDNLVDDVFYRQLVSPDTVHAAIERWGTNGRRGLGELLRSMQVWTPGPPPGSPAEMRMIRRLCEQGAPPPDRQVDIFDGHGRWVARIDAGWPGPRVGLEYYGERYEWLQPRLFPGGVCPNRLI